MPAIYRKEMQSYFYTPAAYVFMGVFLTLSGLFFGLTNLRERSGNLLTLMSMLGYLWMLLSPVLVMRPGAGERAKGTDKLWYSSPCSLTAVVTGKYLAACTVLMLTIGMTFFYAAIVAIWGTLYVAETLVGYLGLILQGCAFLALDLLVSCAVASQATAVIIGVGANLAVWLSDLLADAAGGTVLESVLNFISLYQRFVPFAQGQLRFSCVLYYLAFIFCMLFLCVRVTDRRRWSEA